jgi:hypothetical protein
MFQYAAMVDELTNFHEFSGSHGSNARSWKGHIYVTFYHLQPAQYHIIYIASLTPRHPKFISNFHSTISNFIASSALPYRGAPPSWLKTTPQDVVEHITKLARKGFTPSQIGVTLRDSHGIPQVRFVTGNKILRILKGQGTSPTLPISLLFYLLRNPHSCCRPRPTNPRRPLAPRKKSRRGPQTPRDQPQGQGLEVPLHPHRIPHPPPRPLLQDQAKNTAHIQVRQCDCLDFDRIIRVRFRGGDGPINKGAACSVRESLSTVPHKHDTSRYLYMSCPPQCCSHPQVSTSYCVPASHDPPLLILSSTSCHNHPILRYSSLKERTFRHG